MYAHRAQNPSRTPRHGVKKERRRPRPRRWSVLSPWGCVRLELHLLPVATVFSSRGTTYDTSTTFRRVLECSGNCSGDADLRVATTSAAPAACAAARPPITRGTSLNSVENSNWQERWSEARTKQGEEQAEGWWNEEHAGGWWKDEQTGSSSSAGWWTANDQTPWEPEGPGGAIEVKSVEQKYIKHDRW